MEKNTLTVQDLINILESQDKNAVVCLTDLEDDVKIFRSIKIIESALNEEYIDDGGEFKIGNILLLY